MTRRAVTRLIHKNVYNLEKAAKLHMKVENKLVLLYWCVKTVTMDG